LHDAKNERVKEYPWQPGATSESSAGRSLCHLGNAIRKWSGNRCVFAIPREFSLPFHSPKIPLMGNQNGIFHPDCGEGRKGWDLTPVAGSIFGPLSQRDISKSEFKISKISKACFVLQVIRVT